MSVQAVPSFYVVEFFPDSNGDIEVAVVSSNWMNTNEMEVAWPPCKTDRNLNEALTHHHLPADDWQWYACRRIMYATSKLSNDALMSGFGFTTKVVLSFPASLEQARKKAKDTSGLETGDENVPETQELLCSSRK